MAGAVMPARGASSSVTVTVTPGTAPAANPAYSDAPVSVCVTVTVS